MKRAIILFIAGAALGGGIVWFATRHGAEKETEKEKPAAEKSGEADEEKTSITRDGAGNAVLHMSDDVQGDIGIVVTNPAPATWNPEWKAYGRVVDPAPLAALLNELASAEAASAASSNEFARLKTLAGQGNASPRALQTAEAAAQRDQLAVQSAKDRLTLSWGPAIAGRDDAAGFVRALTVFAAVLVRLDLPAGEVPPAPPNAARVVALSGRSAEAEPLGAALAVDPVVQGRGFLFLIPTNTLHLLAGEAVTGYLQVPGEPLSGVIVPRDAVVRSEGRGWAYVLNADGESFTRKEVALDRPAETGWFVTNSMGDHVVVTGAQTLLSEEQKASLGAD